MRYHFLMFFQAETSSKIHALFVKICLLVQCSVQLAMPSCTWSGARWAGTVPLQSLFDCLTFLELQANKCLTVCSGGPRNSNGFPHNFEVPGRLCRALCSFGVRKCPPRQCESACGLNNTHRVKARVPSRP